MTCYPRMEICNGNIVHSANSGKNSTCVIADDTDVFTLLIHFYKVLKVFKSGEKSLSKPGKTEKRDDDIKNNLLHHIMDIPRKQT